MATAKEKRLERERNDALRALTIVHGENERLRAVLLEFADLCTEFCDHTPESWNRAALALGNRARVMLTPNEQGQGPARRSD